MSAGAVSRGQIISVEDGVGPGGRTVSAGLAIALDDGWKTYWRSPGEVGLPPELSWDGSENIASVTLSYPAPTRFEAFEIQNFGYGQEVLFPLTVMLTEAGKPARLSLDANILVCADVCIPETLSMTLDLPRGGGIDMAAADRLSTWIAQVPKTGEEAGITLEQVHLDDAALTFLARSEVSFGGVDVFPEHGDYAAFGLPEIVLADGGQTLWARLPVLSPGDGALDLTLVDGDRAATLRADPGAAPPARPTTGTGLWGILLVAMLGGLILNVMPCVLPVLSIKLTSALAMADQSRARVRAGFLASVAGVLAFFAVLSGLVIALRAAGVAVGWGIQFQNPVFLALMIGLIVLFAANMLGFFAVGIGSGAMTGMARTESRGGLGGDFATGAFAAVMATPCSAPFIGTAVTYALTHGPTEVLAVFLAMGLGLSAPYLAVAVWPGLIRLLPRPGRWMKTVQAGLACLLLLTAVWLVSVLAASAGWPLALAVSGLAAAMFAALALRRWPVLVGSVGLAAVLAVAMVVPTAPVAVASVATGWDVWSEDRVRDEVAAGQVVFVDVTADWCLTCKANKRLVLDQGAVAEALSQVTALQADWTRPSDTITEYLRANGRFGIPFNQVFGPGAPDGIVLPELLTEAVVLEALARAAD